MTDATRIRRKATTAFPLTSARRAKTILGRIDG
jgi:hypothetical protein